MFCILKWIICTLLHERLNRSSCWDVSVCTDLIPMCVCVCVWKQPACSSPSSSLTSELLQIVWLLIISIHTHTYTSVVCFETICQRVLWHHNNQKPILDLFDSVGISVICLCKGVKFLVVCFWTILPLLFLLSYDWVTIMILQTKGRWNLSDLFGFMLISYYDASSLCNERTKWVWILNCFNLSDTNCWRPWITHLTLYPHRSNTTKQKIQTAP